MLAAALLSTVRGIQAQQHGVVVDHTGLPLPGARVELRRAQRRGHTVTLLPPAYAGPYGIE